MMETSNFFVLFLFLCGMGVVLAALFSERKNPMALAWVASLAAIMILAASGKVLLSGRLWQTELWTLPFLGPLVLKWTVFPPSLFW